MGHMLMRKPLGERVVADADRDAGAVAFALFAWVRVGSLG